MPGQRCRGVGADCVGFVSGVLDVLYGVDTRNRPYFPSDTSFHTASAAVQVIKFLRSRYPSEKSDGTVEPGDVIVGRVGLAEGHIYIVGTQPHSVWHCIPQTGVTRTCLAALTNVAISWRMLEKERWTTRR